MAKIKYEEYFEDFLEQLRDALSDGNAIQIDASNHIWRETAIAELSALKWITVESKVVGKIMLNEYDSASKLVYIIEATERLLKKAPRAAPIGFVTQAR